MPDLSYAELEQQLKTLPKTWVPAMLRVLVTRGVHENVFNPGGLMIFVQDAEAKAVLARTTGVQS